jgi:hypothetical protein
MSLNSYSNEAAMLAEAQGNAKTAGKRKKQQILFDAQGLAARFD